MCILEALTETAGEAAKFSVLCRDVYQRLWVEESLAETKRRAEGKRLLTPVCCMQAHTSHRNIGRISANSLRSLSLLETSALSLPGCPWLPLASAETLQHLVISMTRPDEQDHWAAILEAIAGAAIFRLKHFELHGLSFQPQFFQLLAQRFATLGTLQDLCLDFKGTVPQEDEEFDEEFWKSLEEAPLHSLQLSGLHSVHLCGGLRRLHGLGQLRHLQLGWESADALVSEEAGEELIELLKAGLASGSSQPHGQQMTFQLESLALFGLSRVGNLRLLLETLPLLPLTSLDLSHNVVGQALVEPSMMTILESCHLTKLNLTGSNLNLPAVLNSAAPTLQELRLGGCRAPLGPQGSELQRFLCSLEDLQVLELGNLGQMQPWLRRPLLKLLRSCAPLLRHLQAKLPANLLEVGLGGMFATGTMDRTTLARLEWLELEPGGLVSPAFPALFGSVNTPRLQHLCIAHAALKDGLGSSLLQRLTGISGLRALGLRDCGLGANSARYFNLASWPNLTYLDLSYNRFASAGQELLKKFATTCRLRHLSLRCCDLEADAMVSVGRLVVCLQQLEVFDLGGNERLCCDQSTAQLFLQAAVKEFGQGAFWAWPTVLTSGRLDLRGSVQADVAVSLPKKLEIGRAHV